MKQISKKLILKKKTVAVLNEQELNQVVGGKTYKFCQVSDGPCYPDTERFPGGNAC